MKDEFVGSKDFSVGDYELKSADLSGLTHNFMADLSRRLAPALISEARSMPQANYEEKKEVSKWVNSQLRRFDLALKCPQTGQAAILVAVPHDPAKSGRFAFQFNTPKGQARRGSYATIPDLELIEAKTPVATGFWGNRALLDKGKDSRLRS